MKLGPPILLSLGIHGLYLHQVMSPKNPQKWHYITTLKIFKYNMANKIHNQRKLKASEHSKSL
jgi:hypothetical protein